MTHDKKGFMNFYLRFILRRRWPILLVLITITAASLVMASHGIISSSIGGLFLGENPEYPKYLNRADDFGSDDVIIIAIDDSKFLSPSSQDRIERAVDEISVMPYVKDVRSVLDVQEVVGTDDALYVDTYAEKTRQKPENLESILDNLCKDHFAEGIFVSKDCQHTTVIVELDTDPNRPSEMIPGLIDNIINAFETSGYDRDQLHVVGLSANIAAVMHETYFSIKTLFPIVLVVLLAAVWIMFRRIWPVAITGIVALIAVSWTVGFSIMLDRHVSIFTGILPAIILIISFSDVIHLCSAYLLELNHGKSKKESILASGVDVGKACIFTSVTTFFGFVSLSLIPTPASRLLGISLGFGTATALILAVTLAPILFSFMPAPKTWRKGTAGRVQGLLDRFLSFSAKISFKIPWVIIIIFAVFFAVIITGLTRFTIETDFAKRMSFDHPLRVAGRYFNKNFVGSNTVDVYIRASESNDLLQPEMLRKIAQCQQILEDQPEISKTHSLVDLFETLHKEFDPEDAENNSIPDSREALAQYLLLFEMSGGRDLERLVDFDRRVMRMIIYLPKEEYRHTAAMGNRSSDLIQEKLGDSVEVKASGLVYLLGDFFEVILKGQQTALFLAFMSIAFMMMIGLRSIGAGLWSMFPNVLPLFALCGYLGLFSDYVDSDVIIIAIMAIGIGVDDTIHFLMRFRIESERQDDLQKAVKQTFFYSGRGIVITTVILVIGFAPFAASDYLTINMMGTLLPMTLVVALLADLFFVPALIKVGAIRFKFSTNNYTHKPVT
ncbi:MAG: MMPL family transporter [Deltaproteobacteria bacterium]|nr:MMPL family transporter [Deltaproteobacteria bacterium]